MDVCVHIDQGRNITLEEEFIILFSLVNYYPRQVTIYSEQVVKNANFMLFSMLCVF